MKNPAFSIAIRVALSMLFIQCGFRLASAQTTNNALHFDGIDDRFGINAPKNQASVFNFERTDPFSIEMWIKPDRNTEAALFTKIPQIHQAGFKGYELAIDASGTLRLSLISNQATGNALVANSATPLPFDGKWHHVAATYGGTSKAGSVTLYVDGVSVPTTVVQDNLTASIVQNAGILLGARVYGLSKPHKVYQGAMDEVRVWKKALSPADVASRMNTDLAGNETDLVLYYNFSQGLPNGNNAGVTVPTLPNPAYWTLLQGFALTGNKSNFIARSKTMQALHFDGVDDRFGINGPNTMPKESWVFNFERTSPFSIEMWIKPERNAEAALYTKIPQIHQGGFKGYELAIADGGNLRLSLINNADVNALVVNSQNPLPFDGKWHHVAATYGGTSKAASVTLYVDGVSVPTTATKDNLTESIVQNAGILLGARVDGLSKPFKVYQGAMDEVRVWKKALSANEVSSRMNSELAGNETDLVLYYNFNQGNPNGNNAGVTVSTLPNPVYWTLFTGFALTGTKSNFILSEM
jgi:hypothetical protein